MNHIRRICRSASGLPRRAGLLIASAAPAVLWADPPLPPGWNKYLPLPAGPQPAVRFPPSWNKRPPLPAHPHTVVIGAPPGWHTSLIVIAAAVLAAAVIVIVTRPRRPHAAPAPPMPTSPPQLIKAHNTRGSETVWFCQRPSAARANTGPRRSSTKFRRKLR